MKHQLFTITSLFAMTACSTEFEVAEGQLELVPSLESSPEQTEKQIDNADALAMALPSIDSDSQWVTEVFHQNAGSVTNVLPVFPMGALNVKRVENELHIRMFGEQQAYVKVCTFGSTVDCFAGKFEANDEMLAYDAVIDLEQDGQPERFTITFSDGLSSYSAMGPYDVPSSENIWSEVESCDPVLNIGYSTYELSSSNKGDFVRLDFESDTPASAMVCGLDDADENICVWEELTSGRREIILPVDIRTVFPALIRDQKGCSMTLEIAP